MRKRARQPWLLTRLITRLLTRLLTALALAGVVVLLGAGASGCGANVYASLEEGDAAADATLALENANPEEAVDLILAALGDNYRLTYEGMVLGTDLGAATSTLAGHLGTLIAEGKVDKPANLVSILASARAQLHEVDPFKMALALAENSSNSDSSTESNEMALLFPLLPAASSSHIHGLKVASAILGSLGSQKTAADQFKEALYLTATVALTMKTLDANGDGEVSPLEAITLSTDLAADLLVQIASASASAATSSTGSDGSTVASAAAIESLQSEIDAQEGDTDEDKLRNYIAGADAASS